MSMGAKFKDKFGKIRNHLTSMDNQSLGKAALLIIIFLDIFILGLRIYADDRTTGQV